jgi:hypothetical protein
MTFADFKPKEECHIDFSGAYLRAVFLKDHKTGDILCYHAVYNILEDRYVSRQVSCSRLNTCFLFGELKAYFIYKGRRMYVEEFQKISH